MQHALASTGTSTGGSDFLPEAQMFFGGRPERFIVFISDLVEKAVWERAEMEDWDGSDWEDWMGREKIDWVGAISVDELNRQQYNIFQKEFLKVCKKQYLFMFQCEQPLSRDAELSLAVALGNKQFLTEDQQKALDTAFRIAKKIREADDAEEKSIAVQKKKSIGGTHVKKKKGQKAKTIADKLEDLIYKHPEKADLSAKRLAEILKCSETAIKNSPTWQKIMSNRAKPQVASWKDPGLIPDPSKPDDDQN